MIVTLDMRNCQEQLKEFKVRRVGGSCPHAAELSPLRLHLGICAGLSARVSRYVMIVPHLCNHVLIVSPVPKMCERFLQLIKIPKYELS